VDKRHARKLGYDEAEAKNKSIDIIATPEDDAFVNT